MSAHTCIPPNSIGRMTGEKYYCPDCSQRWVSVKAINPDGRTSIRNEWAVIEP